MKYINLTKEEKILFDHMESMFIGHPIISKKVFVKILRALLDKYS